MRWPRVVRFGTESPSASHERTWEEADIENHRYTFQQQCFCVREQVQPVTIEVRDGRIEEAEASNQEPLVVR
jgi:hypothetical protein